MNPASGKWIDVSKAGDSLAASNSPLNFDTDASAAYEYETIQPSEPLAFSIRSDGLKVGSYFGRYYVEDILGSGGMGSVFLAKDTQLERRVALKTPHFSADSPEVLERFFREAKAAATLNHPNICPVHDVGEIDGTYYLSMAFVQGQPLNECIPEDGLPIKEAVKIVVTLSQALDEAHKAGIIHRDLKPSKVMMNERQEPVIMDFGLARREGLDTKLTQTGAVMGTPAYMAPEQVRGTPDEIGPETDIYELGVILYQLLTGQLPFKGDFIAVIAQIISDTPLKPSSIRPSIPASLDSICFKAINKSPVKRFRSMKEFGDALVNYSSVTVSNEVIDQMDNDAPEAILSKSVVPIFAVIENQVDPQAVSVERIDLQSEMYPSGMQKLPWLTVLISSTILLTLLAIAWRLILFFR